MAKGNLPRWNSSGIKSGIENVSIRQYGYFIDYVYKKFINSHDYIFRGHRKDTYKLEATLDRQIHDKAKIAELRKKQLNNFTMAIRGKRGANPPQYTDEKEWWSLGQHHGLDTPLLDWTYSPFVAAYFAFYKTKSDDTKKRVVYALNKSKVENYLYRTGNNDLIFYQPTSDENPRVLNQNGLFTIVNNGTELEEWVKNNFADEQQERVLIKIQIPNSDRGVSLESLEAMNINHITLFPDIYGASIYSNIKLLRYI